MAANTTSRDRAVHDEVWGKLLALEPDIAFLQEASAPPVGLLAGDSLLGWRATRRWDSAIYAPLLEVVESRAVEEVSMHGQVASARIARDEHLLWLVSIHASTRDAVVPHLKAILSAVDQCFAGSLILAGDFNSCRLADEWYPGYGHLEFFEELELHLTNCHHAVHGKEAQSFFADGYPPFQNDHIFVSTDITVQGCEVLPHQPFKGLSDHVPVIAELAIPGFD
jgi:endonuclease/exonuclease/phosphatase (EEP) superfamily protein YafD